MKRMISLEAVLGTALLDYLDAKRSYRASQLSSRQALAAYLLALEQIRQAV